MSRFGGFAVGQIVREALVKAGLNGDAPCSDNSCMFGVPGGMATNGGCRCFDQMRHVDRVMILRLAKAMKIAVEAALEKGDAEGTFVNRPEVDDAIDDLMATKASIHLERMDKNFYWIGLHNAACDIHIDITSKSKINARIRK